MDVSFTNFTWPQGTKYDRGVNISFTADITLQPGDSLAGAGGSSSVMLSFKDATHAFRMDVSGTGINGALSCPLDAALASWPPAPPPPPPPCTEGRYPYRGCPNLEWYFDRPVVRSQPLLAFIQVLQQWGTYCWSLLAALKFLTTSCIKMGILVLSLEA